MCHFWPKVALLPGQTEKSEVAKAEKMHQQTDFSDQNFWAGLVDSSFGKRSFRASGIKGSLLNLEHCVAVLVWIYFTEKKQKRQQVIIDRFCKFTRKFDKEFWPWISLKISLKIFCVKKGRWHFDICQSIVNTRKTSVVWNESKGSRIWYQQNPARQVYPS